MSKSSQDKSGHPESNYLKDRRKFKTLTPGPSRTQTEFAAECDINNILAKHRNTGLLEHVNTHQGDYGNFIGYPDYHEAMQAVAKAEQMFMSLPSDLRLRFNNDPEAFLQFSQDETNEPEMREMGLIPRKTLEPDANHGAAIEPTGSQASPDAPVEAEAT